MNRAERCGKQNRRQPEAYSGGQSKLRVTSKGKLFRDSHHDETYSPQNRVLDERGARKCEVPKRESAERRNYQHSCGFERESPQHALPKELSERFFKRNTIGPERSLLESRHDAGRYKRCRDNRAFKNEFELRGKDSFSLACAHDFHKGRNKFHDPLKKIDKPGEEQEVHYESPACPNTVGTYEDFSPNAGLRRNRFESGEHCFRNARS